MSDGILVLNAGSSSVKFAVYGAVQPPALLLSGQVQSLGARARFVLKTPDGTPIAEHSWDGGLAHEDAFAYILEQIETVLPQTVIVAAGHRIVHGGAKYAKAVKIDDKVLQDLAELTPLARLHQPHNLAGVAAVERAFPELPQIACFDTAFHAGHPLEADMFALPRPLYDDGIRRYGFHGLSYAYVSKRLAVLSPETAKGGVVIAHLGAGASLCAIKDGRSLDSTMSFTALDGLPMGTRCGALDPGVVLYLLQEIGMATGEVEELLYKKSGLYGISGVSGDFRTLEQSAAPEAREAIDFFAYRISQGVAEMAAALQGLDAIVFTGGIGENSAVLREMVCARLRWLGVSCDAAANKAGAVLISKNEKQPSVWVIPTDEERVIAEKTVRLWRAPLG